MNQIEKTKEYHLFKTLIGNRPLNKTHLKKLKDSIEKDNRLNLHPIIINKDYEVIDGQHRLQAAKALDIEVFYIKSEDVEIDHLITANVNQSSWEAENYIDFFAIKNGLPEYIRIKKMMAQSGLKPKAILTLVIGSVSQNLLLFLKTGKFKFPSEEDPLNILNFYCDFIAYTKDKRIRPQSMFTNHNFTKSLRWIYKTSGFDRLLFFKKLDLRWFDLKPQRGSQEWYQLLLNIYNFKNHNRLEEEYGKN